MVQPEKSFKNVSQIGSLICWKSTTGHHLRVKAKDITLTSNAPHNPLPPHSSLSSHVLSLSPIFTLFLVATPSWDLLLYLLFLLSAMLLSQLSTRLTPSAVRSLLKCHHTRGTFLVTYIKGQYPPRHSLPLYSAMYFLYSSYHHLICYRFIYLFVHCPPPHIRIESTKAKTLSCSLLYP